MIAVYLFAALLALLVVVGLVVSPILEGEPVDDETAPAADRRDAEIETLREVEFEYRTGKLSEEDYRELRARHAEAAVRARREAEEEGVPEVGADAAAAGVERSPAPGPADGAAVGSGAASEAAAAPGPEDTSDAEEAPTLPRCPECGERARRTGARFCSACGSELEDPGG